jgi:hypothetical protein
MDGAKSPSSDAPGSPTRDPRARPQPTAPPQLLLLQIAEQTPRVTSRRRPGRPRKHRDTELCQCHVCRVMRWEQP